MQDKKQSEAIHRLNNLVYQRVMSPEGEAIWSAIEYAAHF